MVSIKFGWLPDFTAYFCNSIQLDQSIRLLTGLDNAGLDIFDRPVSGWFPLLQRASQRKGIIFGLITQNRPSIADVQPLPTVIGNTMKDAISESVRGSKTSIDQPRQIGIG
jgi:hypothetical protein